MRLLLLNPFDAHAGSQRIGRDVAFLLRRGGHDVRVRIGFGSAGFLSELPGVATDLVVASVRARKLIYPLWALLVALPVAFSALRGRIVWANTVYAAPPALLAALLYPGRVVLHLHEASFPKIFMLILRLMAWRGVRLICVSADHAARIGLPAKVLYNMVSLPNGHTLSTRDRFLFVGTTQASKGFSLFVAVSARVRDLPLRAVAYLSDEARHDQALVAAARRAGINIVFGETNPDILYRDGFLLLQATDPALWSETFSLVAVEAATRGVPVAGAGATVLGEVLDGALAFDVPSRDPDEIADAIRVLHADPARYDALRAAGKQRGATFSEQAFIERLKHLLACVDGVSL